LNKRRYERSEAIRIAARLGGKVVESTGIAADAKEERFDVATGAKRIRLSFTG